MLHKKGVHKNRTKQDPRNLGAGGTSTGRGEGICQLMTKDDSCASALDNDSSDWSKRMEGPRSDVTRETKSGM